MAITPRQRQSRRLWKIRALGLGYDEGGGGGGGPSLTDQVIAFFGSGEEGGIWDFTDAANLATATDGTGAVSNGSAVAYCADLSGNSNHLLQSNATFRPTWDSSGYALFTAHTLACSLTSISQPLTRVSRFYQGVWSAGGRVFAGGAANRAILFQNGSSPQLVMFCGSPLGSGVSTALSTYHTVTEKINGASSAYVLNGSSTAITTGNDAVSSFSIGGDTANTNLHQSLRCVRVLMISRALTAEEQTTAESWVAEVL